MTAHVCAFCAKPWPCSLAGLYPHRMKRQKAHGITEGAARPFTQSLEAAPPPSGEGLSRVEKHISPH